MTSQKIVPKGHQPQLMRSGSAVIRDGMLAGELRMIADNGVYRRTSMEMDFGSCGRLVTTSDLHALGSLRTLGHLQRLAIDFSYCPKLRDVVNVGDSIRALPLLAELSLSFAGCENLRDAGAFGAGVEQLPRLRRFTCDLSFCSCDFGRDTNLFGPGITPLPLQHHVL